MTLHTQPEMVGPAVTLTFEETVALLRRAQGAKGKDYVYERQPIVDSEGMATSGCVYFTEDGPSCKVGHILHYKGVTFEDMEAMGQNCTTNVSELVAEKRLVVDLRTEGLLTLVQEKQDEGMPWGRALEEALEEVDDWVVIRQHEDGDDERPWEGPF